MSTNRTVVDGLATQTVACAEAPDCTLDPPLLRLQPHELRLPFGKRIQVLRDEGAQRLAEFRSPNPGPVVDVFGDRDGDIFHRLTVSQFLC